MFDTNFILLILNCKKYNYKRKRQKKDWLESCLPDDFNFFHIQGDPSLNAPYTIDFSDNLITVQCDDGYLFLPKKMAFAFKCINDIFNYKYILKTDDDMKLIKKDFFFKIKDYLQIKTIDYGGKLVILDNDFTSYAHITNEHQEPILLEKTNYCSGHFYFIEKNLVYKLITRFFPQICNRIIEDHTFGYFSSKITTNIKQLTIDIDDDVFVEYPIDGLFTGFYYGEKREILGKEYAQLEYITKNPFYNACKNANNDLSNLAILHSNFISSEDNHPFHSEIYSKIQHLDIWDIICFIPNEKKKYIRISSTSNSAMLYWNFIKIIETAFFPQNIIIKRKHISFFCEMFKVFYIPSHNCLHPMAWKLIQKRFNVYYSLIY